MLRKSATNHPNSSDHVIVFNYFLTETFPRNPLSVHHLNLPIGERLRGPFNPNKITGKLQVDNNSGRKCITCKEDIL